MSIFDENTTKAIESVNKGIIKAKEFEAGLTLQLTGVDKVKGMYGASEESAIVERGVLEEGEQFQYSFKDKEGLSRTHYSTSFPLAITMQNAEVNFGDWLYIKRSGAGKDTTYSVDKVGAANQEESDPSKIPF